MKDCVVPLNANNKYSSISRGKGNIDDSN